jgi:hypothetical protein
MAGTNKAAELLLSLRANATGFVNGVNQARASMGGFFSNMSANLKDLVGRFNSGFDAMKGFFGFFGQIQRVIGGIKMVFNAIKTAYDEMFGTARFERAAEASAKAIEEERNRGELTKELYLEELQDLRAYMAAKKILYTEKGKEITQKVIALEQELIMERKAMAFQDIEFTEKTEKEKLAAKLKYIDELRASGKLTAAEDEKMYKEARTLYHQYLKSLRDEFRNFYAERKAAAFEDVEFSNTAESEKIRSKIEYLKTALVKEKTNVEERKKMLKEIHSLEHQYLKTRESEHKDALEKMKAREKELFQQQVDRIKHLAALGQISVKEEIDRISQLMASMKKDDPEFRKLEVDKYNLEKQLKNKGLDEELARLEYLAELNEASDSATYAKKIELLQKYLIALEGDVRAQEDISNRITALQRSRTLALKKEYQEAANARKREFDDVLRKMDAEEGLESDKLKQKIELLRGYMVSHRLGQEEMQQRAEELSKAEVDLEKAKYEELKKMADEFYGDQKDLWREREAQILSALKKVKRGSEQEKILEENLATAQRNILRRNLEEAERLQAGYNKNVSKGREFELRMAKKIYEESLNAASLTAREKEAIQRRLAKTTDDLLLVSAGKEALKGKEREAALEELRRKQAEAVKGTEAPVNALDAQAAAVGKVYDEIAQGAVIAGRGVKTALIDPLDEFLRKLARVAGLLGQGLGISTPPSGIGGGPTVYKIEVNMNAGALNGAIFDSRNKGKDDAEKWGTEVANVIKEKMRTPVGGGTGVI